MNAIVEAARRFVPSSLKRGTKRFLGMQDMQSRLRNLKAAGFVCKGAVDVGAFEGEWAVLTHHVFCCEVLMIEPQPSKRAPLLDLCGKYPFDLESFGLSEHEAEMSLMLDGTNSQLSTDSVGLPREKDFVRVKVQRLDALLGSRPTRARYNLLKVDVQGFELNVLRGLGEKIAQFEVIVLEVSFIPIGGAPLLLDVLKFMDAHGFRVYDLLPMYYRPLDGALWQGDAFFVRKDSVLVSSNEWS
jgi:FkbM family methyltransferase